MVLQILSGWTDEWHGRLLLVEHQGWQTLVPSSHSLLVPSTTEDPPCWYLPPHKIPLAENRFLQAGNGAVKIQKEKSTQCFMSLNNPQNSEMKFCEKCEVDMLKSHLNYQSLQPWIIISLLLSQYHSRWWKKIIISKFLKRIHFLKNIIIHFVNVETDPRLRYCPDFLTWV